MFLPSDTLQSVAVAMAKSTYVYVERKSKDAMRQIVGARTEAQREDVTPPTAAAGQQEPADEGWNANDG